MKFDYEDDQTRPDRPNKITATLDDVKFVLWLEEIPSQTELICLFADFIRGRLDETGQKKPCDCTSCKIERQHQQQGI